MRKLFDFLTGRTWARKILVEFQASFPGRCPICSYHRYGVQNGHVRPGVKVRPHAGCPEGK